MIVSWSVWQLLEYVSWNKWTWLCLFFTAPDLAWEPALKKTKVELDLSTDIDMFLMVEKGIRGGICHAIHRYTKANDKYIKIHDENKESSYLKYCDVNNLYGCAMP